MNQLNLINLSLRLIIVARHCLVITTSESHICHRPDFSFVTGIVSTGTNLLSQRLIRAWSNPLGTNASHLYRLVDLPGTSVMSLHLYRAKTTPGTNVGTFVPPVSWFGKMCNSYNSFFFPLPEPPPHSSSSSLQLKLPLPNGVLGSFCPFCDIFSTISLIEVVEVSYFTPLIYGCRFKFYASNLKYSWNVFEWSKNDDFLFKCIFVYVLIE
jgi:hypothetical protein